MNTIHSIKEANAVLANYMPQVKELLGQDITLARMTPLMNMLGNPQDKLRIIHIAGTSGKTSTAYYVANLLRQTGKKVGLTVSPHVDSVTERVQIDLEPVTDAEFCALLGEFVNLIKDVQPLPTYFELLIALAYWYFDRENVDYAVIETGLGGLHDASNIAKRSDKICVITDIGLDHMHVLGTTLEEIALQKAGIIHVNNQIFTYDQSPDVMTVLHAVASQKNATLNVLSNYVTPSREVEIAMTPMPMYQQRNWLLAKQVFSYITKRDSLSQLGTLELARSIEIKIPGRMEVWHISGKTLIMDGAHNDQKIQAFVASFQAMYPGKKATIVLALKKGKEYQTVLPHLLSISSRLILTAFDTSQDLPVKAINPRILADFAEKIGFVKTEIVADPVDATQQFLTGDDSMLIVTGSFYLLSCVRQAIMRNND